jgi:hypothetical protein
MSIRYYESSQRMEIWFTLNFNLLFSLLKFSFEI